ncbi:MAG: hypothetical protein ABRQ38_20710 [Candidatus Eremiobacterota bacterium]
MKFFLIFIIVMLIFIPSIICISSEPDSSPSPGAEIKKPVSGKIKNGMQLSISAREIKKDSGGNIISVTVEAELKNVSKNNVTMIVSHCNPDHFYEASINRMNFISPILIIHCAYCGYEKIFKPGDSVISILEIKSQGQNIETISLRYPLNKDYIESGTLIF